MEILIEMPKEVLNTPKVENEVRFNSLYERMCYLHDLFKKEGDTDAVSD